MPETLTRIEKAQVTGGQAVVQALVREGVTTVFGIISIHSLPIFDALRAEPGIRLIVPRHEMAGGFMADAYSRVTGKPGVYLTSTGPGAVNSLGAFAESWCAGSRTLQITSQIESHLIGADANMLHEVKEQLAMFRACGAEAIHARGVEDIAPGIRRAMGALRSGRPAPQVVEVPIDFQYASGGVEIEDPVAEEMLEPDPRALDRAVELMVRAERPVL